MTPPNLPSLPGLTWSRHKKPGFSTRVASHVSGREVRLALMSYPLYEFEASYSGLSSASAPVAAQAGLGASSLQSLMGFFLQLLGQAGVFLYTDPDDNAVTAQNIGVGDGVTQSFIMGRTLGGFNEPVSYVTAVDNVYLNGVNQGAAGIGWLFTPPNMLAFATAPGAGVAITANFTFAFQCRFLDDQLDFEEFMSSLWKLDSLKFRSIKANASTSGAAIPAWYSPYAIGGASPYGFADFTTEGATNRYLYNGAVYSSGAAWLSGVGGTYTNSTGKHVTNASGILASVAANTLPFDHDNQGNPLGLLLEGGSTNLLTQSQLASGWTGSQGTLTANAAVAPDGTTTAALFVPNTTNTYHLADNSVTTSTPVVFSVYVAPAGYTHAFVSSGSNNVVSFNLSTGTVESTLGSGWSAAGIQVLKNGWCRIWAYQSASTTLGNVAVFPSNAVLTNGNAPAMFAGDGSSGIYVWGAQIEANASFPSSYIPTTSSSATRAADSLFLPWTATAFTARIKATMIVEVDNGRLLGAGSGGLLCQASGPNATTNNGSNTLSTAVDAWASPNIVILGGSLSGRVLSANGNAAITDGNVLLPSAPSHIYVGTEAGGGNASNGHFVQVGLWNVAPTAAQAVTLSSLV